MVTPTDIADTFESELENAVSNLSPTPEVWLKNAEFDNDQPVVVYEEFPQKLPYNYTARGYSDVKTNNSGEVIDELWREYMRNVYEVTVEASGELEKNDVYTNIRRHFNRYSQWMDSSDFHADCINVDVRNAQPDDRTDAENTLRRDVIKIHVDFYDEVERYGSQNKTGDPIRQVNHDVEGKKYDTT